MCWNAPVSILSGLLAIGCSVYLILRNQFGDRFIAALLIGSGIMQFAEAYAWRNLQDPNNFTYIHSVLLVQVPLVALVAYSYAPAKSFLRKPIWTFLYFLLVALYVYYSLQKLQQLPTEITIGPNGHFNWNIWPSKEKENGIGWLIKSIYLTILFVSFVPYIASYRVRMVCFLYVLFLSTIYLLYGQTLEFESMWCWAVNIIGLYAVFS
jgi:hypothetical protein